MTWYSLECVDLTNFLCFALIHHLLLALKLCFPASPAAGLPNEHKSYK